MTRRGVVAEHKLQLVSDQTSSHGSRLGPTSSFGGGAEEYFRILKIDVVWGALTRSEEHGINSERKGGAKAFPPKQLRDQPPGAELP